MPPCPRDLTGDFADGVHEDLLREIDDLKSENEYLKVRFINWLINSFIRLVIMANTIYLFIYFFCMV